MKKEKEDCAEREGNLGLKKLLKSVGLNKISGDIMIRKFWNWKM